MRAGVIGSETVGSGAAPVAACHCQALRQAARRVTAFYDAALAPLGLRVSQFSILSRLQRHGPRGIQALAAELVMDRTTLGRNIRPLERDGLLCAVADPADGRSRLLSITSRGAELVEAAWPVWIAAQAGFEARFGAEPAARLQAALQGVVTALHSSEE
jgi:DNA-binding MarR family transcriptional regulator